MSNQINVSTPAEVKKKRLREKVIPLLMIFLVIAITVVLFVYQDKVAELGNYGYLSAFLISLVTNASVILPMPGFLILISLAATFNLVLVGLAVFSAVTAPYTSELALRQAQQQLASPPATRPRK